MTSTKDDNGIDEFGKHEILDRTYMMMESHSTFLLEHANFDEMPESIKTRLKNIHTDYYLTYQLIALWRNDHDSVKQVK